MGSDVVAGAVIPIRWLISSERVLGRGVAKSFPVWEVREMVERMFTVNVDLLGYVMGIRLWEVIRIDRVVHEEHCLVVGCVIRKGESGSGAESFFNVRNVT